MSTDTPAPPNDNHQPIARRRIRSYTLRQGRITESQHKALEDLWPIFGLETDQAFDARAVFGREAPTIVEIGFGNGESLARMATDAPDTHFLGIEVHRPGIGHLLLRLREAGLSNVRVYRGDAVEFLANRIPDGGLSGINLFFPDPWPKARHHKRRILNPEFARLVADKLKSGGIFHAATDWEDYARQMLEVLRDCTGLENTQADGGFTPRPAHRPPTKFEARGERLGHGVWDLVFVRR
ncbi:tRNA (guanine-N(7)-)-methyltransferase [Methylomagnum ishizawai]|uniref:tRNA (guanine-N(7)-)-methyltransferase n=1 Tax=Methylomagnum ishizawai TaxID=1760988 RepID=A0A1Y6CZY7_9GAMM|nr:tRNA (guanosine(46)-N7)-methyltransferase TrmB [Methylomagnum ishizawai]SMF96258.1 tRNA (guanine-N(7)-)-methyltransferase [Methylomagnum ishizawai]